MVALRRRPVCRNNRNPLCGNGGRELRSAEKTRGRSDVIVEYVNNEGPNTVKGIVRRLAASAKSLDAVSAFATSAGVNAVLPYLRQIAERGSVRLTVGLYQGITEPAALRALRGAAKAYPGRFAVSVAKNLKLHRKVYAFGFPGKTMLLVGSSNLTDDGLNS